MKEKGELQKLMQEREFMLEQLRDLMRQQKELVGVEDLREKRVVQDALLMMFSKHGFPFYLICQMIEHVMVCLNGALELLADFKVEFRMNLDDQKSMERSEPMFMIRRGGFPPYDIALGSGFERFLVAILWRVHVTRMFHPHRMLPMNWLIFDESFHFWDASNLGQLELLFQHLTMYAPHILLITHIPQVSDFAQRSLKIERVGGLSLARYPVDTEEVVEAVVEKKESKRDLLVKRAIEMGIDVMKEGKNGRRVRKTVGELEKEIKKNINC
jgi:hypothetical protein